MFRRLALQRLRAAVISPGFWTFLLCPMLDVRFSRRFYATLFAALSAVLIAVAVVYRTSLPILQWSLLAGFCSVCLSTNALGGWLSTVSPKEDENRLGAWYNVANIGAGGVMALVGVELIDHLPFWLAALILGGMIFLPTSIFLLIPAPGPDRRLASESFRGFVGEIFALLRRSEVLIAILLFAAPASTFALTNILGALGDDFHCSAHLVSILGGAGMAGAGTFGSLLFPIFAKRMALRSLYLTIGAVGAVFTLSLTLLPHTPGTFAVAYVGENIFQALAYTGVFAISFETVGQNNPLAATTFSVLQAAAIVPLVYMQVVDGRAYTARGVNGSYAVDAGIGMAACLLLALVLRFAKRPRA